MTDDSTAAPDDDAMFPSSERVVRLRFTPASIVGAVALFGAVLALVAVFDSAVRPLSWLLVAVIIAAILEPAVGLASRVVPRALAIVGVMMASLLVVAGVGALLADDLREQYERLERQLPSAAQELEESSEFGRFARSFDLEERVTDFVHDLPDRLVGGSTVDVIQSAADRGAIFLVTGVLSLFMVVYGPTFVSGALGQITDEERRRRVDGLLGSAYGRSWRYLALTTAKAALAGGFTTVVCVILGVEAPVTLGIWVAVWSFVPALGIVVGSIPVVLVSVLDGVGTAAAVLALFVAYQVFDVLVIQRRITARSLRVGPALTIVVGVLGLELYGVGGLIVGVILLAFAVGVADGLAPDDPDEVHGGVRHVVDGASGPETPGTMRPA